MAFPTKPTTGNGRILHTSQANTTATRTFPNLSSLTFNAGDLLIAVVVAYQTSTGTDAAFSSWGGGFTEFSDRATSTTMAIGMAYKFATGSESGTFTVTQAGTITGHAVMVVMSIAGAHASTPPEASTKTDGTSTSPSSPILNPSGWDVEDTLWIAVCGVGEVTTSGSFTGVSGAPGGTTPTWTDLFGSGTLTQDAAGGVEPGFAFGERAVSQLQHTGFSVDTSSARNSQMIVAVRPAAGIPNGSAIGTITWAGSATGARVSSGASTGTITWAGTATGTSVHSGSASGTITWAGSATGEAPAEVSDGSATGTITWAGSATGAATHTGSASGNITWAGSATGATTHSGASTGTITWTGVATGSHISTGAATGTVTWAGSATGESPAEGVNEGSADGTITWTGTATGTSAHVGSSSGTITWTGVAEGQTDYSGDATGTITWVGEAFGFSEDRYYALSGGGGIASSLSPGGEPSRIESG